MPVLGSLAPRLLLAAHGTTSAVGSATTRRLAMAISSQRPDVRVELCFLDVNEPTLEQCLDGVQQPTVVVPLLLSTGFHVTIDIPAAVADHAGVSIARHLGPHPSLAEAMMDRLMETGMSAATGSTLMAAAGSTQPEAVEEIDAARQLLARRLGSAVTMCTMNDDLVAVIAPLPPPVRIAPYLLAEGVFSERLAAAAGSTAVVTRPLGTHPAVVSLVWHRYDEVVGEPLTARERNHQ